MNDTSALRSIAATTIITRKN